MHRGVGVVLLVGGTMVVAVAGSRAPEALAGAGLFHVRAVELEGARFLEAEELARLMAIPPDGSVWDDTEPLLERVRTHPLVREARIRRRLPATLVVEVVEREPVAFLPMPVLTPVDRDGRLLPVDPAAHRLDLPILQPVREPWREGATLTPAEVRVLAGEVGRLAEMEPGTLASVSELAADAGGDVLVRLADPDVTLRYRPPLAPGRLREGLRVLSDALERRPGQIPEVVDLRYDDQVVVRFRHPNRS
jgi:hypothetical protein